MSLQHVDKERKGEITKKLLVAKMVRELRQGRSLEDIQREVFEMIKEIKAGVEETASVVSEIYEEAIERHLEEQNTKLAELGNPQPPEGAMETKEE